LTSEPTRESEPEKALNHEVCSTKFEDRPRDPVRSLARPLVSDPARDNEPERDLERETCSTRPDDSPREPDRVLARPLVSDPARDNEPDRDLSHEVCSTRPEAIVKVEVRLAEHERGLELQISFPESTLATMLPIVNVIEAASVLKREFFSMRLEARVKEPLRDLKSEVCLARAEARVRELLSDLKIEVFSAKLETELSEPPNDLNIEVILAKAEAEVSDPLRLRAWSHPGVMKSIAVLIVVSVIVVAVVVPEYCHATQTSNAKKLPLVQVICDWLAVVYVLSVAVVELATLVAVSQFFHRRVAVVQLLVVQDHAVTKYRATGAPVAEPTAPVKSICHVPDWMSNNPFWIPATL
jgi:hypothetical protein